MTDPISDLIAREGGYVNHPADHGGPTKYGITLATMRHWRKDPALNADDVAALTEAEAGKIYRSLFVERPGYSEIRPTDLMWHVVDCAVLSGPRRATRWLQRAINSVAENKIAEDGIMGPVTLKSIGRTGPRIRRINNELMAIRLRFLARLAQGDANAVRNGLKRADSSRALFVAGWVDRALKFMQ